MNIMSWRIECNSLNRNEDDTECKRKIFHWIIRNDSKRKWAYESEIEQRKRKCQTGDDTQRSTHKKTKATFTVWEKVKREKCTRLPPKRKCRMTHSTGSAFFVRFTVSGTDGHRIRCVCISHFRHNCARCQPVTAHTHTHIPCKRMDYVCLWKSIHHLCTLDYVLDTNPLGFVQLMLNWTVTRFGERKKCKLHFNWATRRRESSHRDWSQRRSKLPEIDVKQRLFRAVLDS